MANNLHTQHSQNTQHNVNSINNTADAELNLQNYKMNLKPLNDYISDLNSRNSKFGDYIPSLKETVNNVFSYDELYKKLIEESYYICNELVNKRTQNSQHTRNVNDRGNTQNYFIGEGHINRELIFKSTENLERSKRNEPTEQSELLSPIIKPSHDDTKSYFYSTNNKFANTEAKNFLDPNKGRVEKEATITKEKNSKTQFPDLDLLYLINNTKEVEKLLEREDPVRRIENFENRIMNNIRKLEQMESEELHIVEAKQELDMKSNEVNSLLKQFENKFDKLEEYLELVKSTPQKNNNYTQNFPPQNNSFHYKPDFYSERPRGKNTYEGNNYVLTTENEENTNDRSKYTIKGRDIPVSINESQSQNRNMSFNEKDYYNSGSDVRSIPESKYNILNNSKYRNNYIKTDSDHYDNENDFDAEVSDRRVPRDVSKKINSFLANSNLKEASELWKKFNYDKFEGMSFDRSYEMLAYLAKLKDKEVDLLSRKVHVLEEKCQEMRRKDNEIVELFAELELYKNKVKLLEYSASERQKGEMKTSSLVKENTLLYKENVKLKALLQQEKYLNSNSSGKDNFNSTNTNTFNSSKYKNPFI